MVEENNLDIIKIMETLPHRFPFLLIDKVKSRCRPEDLLKGDWIGAKVVGIKNVSMNEPYFPGHFPTDPIVPGVKIIESMAQACAMLVERPSPDGEKWSFYIGGVSKAKFRQPVRPGDVLELHCTVKKARSHTFVFDCLGIVDGVKKAEAEILAKMFK